MPVWKNIDIEKANKGDIFMEGTMKRLMLMGKGGPWEMHEVPIPKPGYGEVLVKVLATSVCNQTDLNAIRCKHPPHEMQSHSMLPHHLRVWDKRLDGDELAPYYNKGPVTLEPYPTTMGHEGMGVVVEIGPCDKQESPWDTPLQVGDRVALFCESTFSQYVVAKQDYCFKVPDCLTNEEASLFEPWTILWASCQTTIKYGDVVCILGQGALGSFATQWARINGAKTIITSEPVPYKRELSKKWGADIVLDPTTQDITAEIDRITGGIGCDVVFECAGEPATIKTAPYITRYDGTIVQIGACCDPVYVEWGYIHFKGLLVHSSTSSYAALQHARLDDPYKKCMADAAREKEAGRFNIRDMITHHPKFTVEGVTELFREIEEQGTVLKAVFNPWDGEADK